MIFEYLGKILKIILVKTSNWLADEVEIEQTIPSPRGAVGSDEQTDVTDVTDEAWWRCVY